MTMTDPPDVPKVLAYVVRTARTISGDRELLVHEHRDAPEAGVQVPAGSIEPGESPLDAVRRELSEESGLRFDAPPTLLRVYRWHNEFTGRWNRRHVFLFEADRPLPDRWDHRITGRGEDREMIFCYRWLALHDAARVLCGDQGGSIPWISNPSSGPLQ